MSRLCRLYAPSFQPCRDAPRRRVRLSALQFALPDGENAPSSTFQGVGDLTVPLLIAGELGRPEIGAWLRGRRFAAAGMTMPEASMNEDGGTVFRQDDVRASGQILAGDAIAKTQGVKPSTQVDLRLGRTSTLRRIPKLWYSSVVWISQHMRSARNLMYPEHGRALQLRTAFSAWGFVGLVLGRRSNLLCR